VADNTPLSHAVELGAATIYVLPTGIACALSEAPHGALAMMVQAITVLIRRRMLDEIESYTGDARLLVLPPPCPQPVQPLDFTRADELITRTREAAGAYLDAPPGGALGPDHPLRPHRH
jgi:NTE family protein